jgi:hypothetical protein
MQVGGSRKQLCDMSPKSQKLIDKPQMLTLDSVMVRPSCVVSTTGAKAVPPAHHGLCGPQRVGRRPRVQDRIRGHRDEQTHSGLCCFSVFGWAEGLPRLSNIRLTFEYVPSNMCVCEPQRALAWVTPHDRFDVPYRSAESESRGDNPVGTCTRHQCVTIGV